MLNHVTKLCAYHSDEKLELVQKHQDNDMITYVFEIAFILALPLFIYLQIISIPFVTLQWRRGKFIIESPLHCNYLTTYDLEQMQQSLGNCNTFPFCNLHQYQYQHHSDKVIGKMLLKQGNDVVLWNIIMLQHIRSHCVTNVIIQPTAHALEVASTTNSKPSITRVNIIIMWGLNYEVTSLAAALT